MIGWTPKLKMLLSTDSSSNLPKEFTGSQDALSLKRVQHQEIVFTGDNVSRFATHCKFQKLVIARVATVVDPDINLPPFGCAGKRGQKQPHLILGDVRAEFFTVEHFVKLCQDRLGEEDRATVQGTVERAPCC